MPRALFFVPITGSGTREDPVRAAYAHESSAGVVRGGSIRYSTSDVAIAMIDAPQSYLDSVAAQPDATLLATATNIDQVLNQSQVNAVRAVLEANFIPQQLAQVGDTRRQVIRKIAGVFLFSQRMEGTFGTGWRARAVDRGVTLDTEWQDFPQVLRDEFIAIRDSFGWQVTLPTPPTLRNIMQVITQQFEGTPFYIGGLEI